MKRIKIHLLESNRTYTTMEIAETLKVHPRTVQMWHKKGLPAIQGGKPLLYSGRIAKRYLKAKSQQRKVLLEFSEFYCLKCKKSVRAVPGSIRVIPKKAMGRYQQYLLTGRCERCQGVINRISTSKYMAEIFELVSQQNHSAVS